MPRGFMLSKNMNGEWEITAHRIPRGESLTDVARRFMHSCREYSQSAVMTTGTSSS